METIYVILLKTSALLGIFYLVYVWFLKSETFFSFNRHFLLIGALASVVLPYYTYTSYVVIESSTFTNIQNPDAIPETITLISSFNWPLLLYTIYFIGVLYMSIKLIKSLISIYTLFKSANLIKVDGFTLLETSKNINPFSFFNYIFYNPSLYTKEELSSILSHEKAHATQQHSIDVLLINFFCIYTWFTPFSWWYKNTIQQNLEYLADECAAQKSNSIQNYQYALLKASGNPLNISIVNNFNTSLIKKRIVMLNKSKSNNKNLLKTLIILPALALFLYSFNTNTIYSRTDTHNKKAEIASTIIEILINKNTTDQELQNIKKDLATHNVSFKYSVKYNKANEITKINIALIAKKEGSSSKSSSSYNNKNKAITPILISYNADSNTINISNQTSEHDSSVHVWKQDEQTLSKSKTIEIIKENGVETIIVNGETISPEEYKVLHASDHENLNITKSIHSDSDTNSLIIIKTNSSDEDNVIKIRSHSDNDHNTFMIKHNDDEAPLYFINGKEVKAKEFKNIDKTSVLSIDVLKGEKAVTKYGKKAKHGVIEITVKPE